MTKETVKKLESISKQLGNILVGQGPKRAEWTTYKTFADALLEINNDIEELNSRDKENPKEIIAEEISKFFQNTMKEKDKKPKSKKITKKVENDEDDLYDEEIEESTNDD